MPGLLLHDIPTARAYIDNKTLRDRLTRITNAAADQMYMNHVHPRELFGGGPLGTVDATKFWECVTMFFLITAQWEHEGHPEWESLHLACRYALEAMFRNRRPEERLNPSARQYFLSHRR